MSKKNAATKSEPEALPDVCAIGGFNLFYTWACALSSLPPSEVERRVNIENPCGTSGGWEIILDNEGDNEGKGPPSPAPMTRTERTTSWRP